MSEGAYLSLQDVQGEFLRVELPEKVVVEDSEEQSSSSGSEDSRQVVKSIQKNNAELRSRNDELCGEQDKLKEELQNTKVRVTDLWQTNCDQMWEANEIIVAKNEEIAALRNQLRLLGNARAVPGVLGVTETSISGPHLTHPSVSSSSVVGCSVSDPAVFGGGHVSRGGAHVSRGGMAPPVDPFTGEERQSI